MSFSILTLVFALVLQWLPINAATKLGVSDRKTEREIDSLQGLPSGFDMIYIHTYLALADRNMQDKFALRVVLEF